MKTRGMLSELTELTSADGDTLVYHNIRCIARLYSIIYDVQYLFEIIGLSFDRYNLRPRRHELVLAIKGDARNFIERQLFKDTY